MKLRNRILTCALASLTALAGIVSAVAGAQTAPVSTPFKGRDNQATFVVYRDASGNVACREATAEEHRRISAARAGAGGDLRLIYRGAPRTRTPYGIVEDFSTAGPVSSKDAATSGGLPALLPSAGLHIFLHGTTNLEANQQAKNAFIVAANRWESLISTPINVVIDVDYGPDFFGQAYNDSRILGQTGSSSNQTTVSDLRQRLINNSPTPAELQVYNALPASTIPVEGDAGAATASGVTLTRANARALGLAANITNPDSVALMRGDAGIGFNSAFPFDFDPSDGISSGQTDFDAVVTHEIGHALGFISRSGGGGTSPLSIWDVFRFRTGVSLGTFATAPRVMAASGSQFFFNNVTHTVANSNGSTFTTQELGLSTGGPDGDATGGDGRQSSHWKDDSLTPTRPYIGIMDPTIGSGVRRVITDNDTNALDLFGYSIGGVVGPPPPPPPGPANDNFANSVALAGAGGAISGNNLNATPETGEPLHNIVLPDGSRLPSETTVWYTWTSPTTGTATFDTIGSNFDTILAVFTGPAVNALSRVAENDDIVLAQDVQSRVTFPTQAGVTYRIQIDGFDGDAGTFQLNWTSNGSAPTPTPSYSVSGRVVDPDGTPLANVQISLDGPPLTNGFTAMPTTTAADGTYSFSLLSGGGNYSVRGSDPRYTFAGGPYVFNNINFNQTGVNFTASAPATATGTVTLSGGPLQGVAVGLFGGNPSRLIRQTTTDATGRWTLNGMTVGQTYSFVLLKSGYTFSPSSFTGAIPVASYSVGNAVATKTNPIEASDFFVTQHYRDFLGREPDASGLAFWVNQIESCGFNTQCRDVRRINVSGAFFLSIEFQNTGYLVERMYKTAYGDVTEASTGLVVPVVRREEFMADTPLIANGVIVGQGDWQGLLETNKTAYALTFVLRDRFKTAFPATMTPQAFVDKLNANTGGTLSAAQVSALVAELTANNTDAGRAAVLRKVAENGELDRREKNRAFVLMQYYGYLRRNPNDAPEANLNFAGWNFWLTKLNQFNGDFAKAEMVKAFLAASEYRNRFAQ